MSKIDEQETSTEEIEFLENSGKQNAVEDMEYDLPPLVPEEEDYDDGGGRHPFWKRVFLLVLILAVFGGVGYVYRAQILQLFQTFVSKEEAPQSTSDGTETAAEGETAPEESFTVTTEGTEEEQTLVMQFDTTAKSKFLSTGQENFFYCTKDGMKYFEGMQNQIWNQTFTFQTPSVTQQGEYVAVCELQGRNAMVFHTTGQVYAVQADGQILQYSLNPNGALALLLKNGSSYKIQVFSSAGELMMERFEEDTGVYPLALSLSNDEKVLAVSYLDTTAVEMSTKVLLFYTTRADTESTDTGDYFASVIESGVVSPLIWCADNGNFVVVSDHGIFAVAPDGNRAWSVEMGNKITVVDHYGDYFAVALGEAYPQAEGLPEGTVLFFSQTGQQRSSFEAEGAVTYLKCSSNGTVVGCGHDFWAVAPGSGKAAWHYLAAGDVQDILLVSKTKGLLVTGTSAKFQDFNEK